MEIDRRLFFASLGGAAAVATMSHEARAEALEHYMSDLLEEPADDTPEKFPKAADLEAQIETKASRRGVGAIFVANRENVKRRDAFVSI